jgi:GT2 family glycosyltransferase/glycosyltransferase involved in cell wall biosynthesis
LTAAVPTSDVAVIIPNWNGKQHLVSCLTSLRQLDADGPSPRILLVDNGSTDGSVQLVRKRFPEVELALLDENVGFARACNLGAQRATTPVVAFLNNDMRVDPRWLAELVPPLNTSEGIVCSASRVLSWDGRTADFEGGEMNLEGRAFQRGFGLPPKRYPAATDVLYANGGAMAVIRETFLEVGGFDEDFFAYYEDSDFGWRLWVLGYRVVFVPNSVCYHRHHGTSRALSPAQKRYLLERNALRTVVKNYAPDTLARVLPTTLMLTLRRALQLLGTDTTGYIPPQTYEGPAAENVPSEAVAHMVALYDFALSLPRTYEKTGVIQSRRGRSDDEVLQRFGRFLEPTVGGRPYRLRQHQLVRLLGVRAPQPQRQRKKVLVVSPDLVPMEGAPATGSGLRAWSIGKGLEAKGHEVVFSIPRRAVARLRHVSREAEELCWDEDTLAPLVRDVAPDVVVACGWSILTHLPDPPHPVALDFHGPHVLERYWQGHMTLAENVQEKLSAIGRADFYTCAGNRQRLYFLSWLMQAGVEPQEEIIQQIPVSLSPELPGHRSRGTGKVVFGGVFLPWQDPSTALEAAAGRMDELGRGELLLFGGRHPFLDLDQGVYTALLKRLERQPRVTVSRMVPRAELLEIYAAADAAIDVMAWNFERELAFTTRTVEYLWCGLPVVYNNYADVADLIRQYDAGWIVDPTDGRQVSEAVEQVLTDPEETERKGRNAQRLVRERLTWDQTIDPLDRFCRDPVFRRHESTTTSSSRGAEVELLRMMRDKDVHIRNLEALLAKRRSFVSRSAYYLRRSHHYLATAGLRGFVRQSVRFLRYRAGRRG